MWQSALNTIFKIMGNHVQRSIIFAQNGSYNNILLLLVGSFCSAAVISFELCKIHNVVHVYTMYATGIIRLSLFKLGVTICFLAPPCPQGPLSHTHLNTKVKYAG